MPETGCTMQDVARQAGVHVATVSRALRKCGGVSEEVRAKVLRIAADLGYRTNPLVSALIRSRRNPHRTDYHATLGCLIPPWPATAPAYRHDYVQLLEGMQTRAAAFGYRLAEFNLEQAGMSAHRLSEILAARNIAGLVLPPLHVAQDSVAVDWQRWPVVAIGYSQQIPIPRVVHNHARAMRTAVAECRQHGRTRIGLVLPRRLSPKVEDLWLAAYLLEQHLAAAPVEILPPLLLGEGAECEAFGAWRAAQRPDAIIGLQHLTPIDDWLRAARRRVPEKVALVTLDCREQGQRFAGIDQNHALLGDLAVEQLVGLVERNVPAAQRMPTVLAVDGKWRDGPTLTPVRR